VSQDRGGTSDTQQWREMAGHLTQAHGGDPSALISYAPTPEQLYFAHADTHVALASIDAAPPDRHTHLLPMNAGWHDARTSSCRPFQPSPQAQDDQFASFAFPLPYMTGLPHTWMVPGSEAELADWAAGQPFPDLSENSAGSVRLAAANAAARWAAIVSFPGPVLARPDAQLDYGIARQPGRQVPRQARRR
jgi:hypothetical protein